MAIFQLPTEWTPPRIETEETARTAFQQDPFFESAMELAKRLLHAAGYADEVIPPLADALGNVGLKLARQAAEPVCTGHLADIARVEKTVRGLFGLLEMGRDLNAIPSDLDHVLRQLCANCLDGLGDLKKKSTLRPAVGAEWSTMNLVATDVWSDDEQFSDDATG